MEKLRDAFAHVSCGDTCVGASQIAFSLFVNHDGTDDSFDADTDSDRPQIGENLAKNNRKYCIGAVKHVTAKQMIEAKNSGTLNELVKMDGYEQSACRQHATRQGIFWICGLKLAEES